MNYNDYSRKLFLVQFLNHFDLREPQKVVYRENLIRTRVGAFRDTNPGSARQGTAASRPVGHPGVGEGPTEQPAAMGRHYRPAPPEENDSSVTRCLREAACVGKPSWTHSRRKRSSQRPSPSSSARTLWRMRTEGRSRSRGGSTIGLSFFIQPIADARVRKVLSE